MTNEKNQTSSAPVSTTPQTKPKSKTGIMVAVILIVVVVLGVGGYFASRYVARKAGEKLAEGILKAGTGGNVDVNSSGDGAKVETGDGSLSVGSSASWPKDMPNSVPEFKYGKITMAVSTDTNGKGWSVTYEAVESGAMEKYASDLSSAGWTKEDTADMGAGLSILSYSKDSYQIQAIYDASSKGVSLAVTTK